MNLIKTSRRDMIIMQTILIVIAVIWLFPLLSAVQRSLEFQGLDNYKSLFTNPANGVPITQLYLNSAIIAVFHVIFVLVVASLAGFAFNQLDFFGKEFIYYAIVVCLSVPAIVVLVPLFYTLKQAGLLNSYIGVALTEAALTLPFGILMLRNYGDNIPREFSEAATIDGAGPWELFRYIYLPLARPALINLATLSALWSFQDFLLPAVFITNARLTTAAVAAQSFRDYQGFTALTIGRYNASLVLLALPALVLLIFGQRFIISGLTSGGIKS